MYLKFECVWPVDYLNVERLVEMDGKVATNGAAEQEHIHRESVRYIITTRNRPSKKKTLPTKNLVLPHTNTL